MGMTVTLFMTSRQFGPVVELCPLAPAGGAAGFDESMGQEVCISEIRQKECAVTNVGINAEPSHGLHALGSGDNRP